MVRINRTEAQQLVTAGQEESKILGESIVTYNDALIVVYKIREPDACLAALRQAQAERRRAYNTAREDYDIASQAIRQQAQQKRNQAVEEQQDEASQRPRWWQ